MLALAGAAKVSETLRLHRVRYLCRAVVTAPSVVLRLFDYQLQNKASWSCQVLGDLRQLSSDNPCLLELVADRHQPHAWFASVAQQPRTWLLAAKRAHRKLAGSARPHRRSSPTGAAGSAGGPSPERTSGQLSSSEAPPGLAEPSGLAAGAPPPRSEQPTGLAEPPGLAAGAPQPRSTAAGPPPERTGGPGGSSPATPGLTARGRPSTGAASSAGGPPPERTGGPSARQPPDHPRSAGRADRSPAAGPPPERTGGPGGTSPPTSGLAARDRPSPSAAGAGSSPPPERTGGPGVADDTGQAGASAPESPYSPDAPRPEHEPECSQCGKRFPDALLLSQHMAIAHGIKNQTRRLIAGTQCLACGMEFHERTRIFRHVAYNSQRCKILYVNNIEPMSQQEANELDKVANTHSRKKSSKALSLPRVLVISA